MNRNQVLGLHTDLLLIDGMNQIMRNYFAITGLSTSYGGNTNIIYGFLQSLSITANKYNPQGIVVVWEGSNSNAYRREIYPQYKGDRKERGKDINWDDIHNQADIVKDFLIELGVSMIAVPNKEADDVIASFCYTYPNKKIVINSSDNDFLQLITPNIRWYNGSIEINHKNFYSEMDLPLERFLDYKVLITDKSDCIPGIKGVGKKTAKNLLNKISLDKYIENYNEKSALPRTKNLFKPDAKEIIERNRKLMDLKLNIVSKAVLTGGVETSQLNIDSVGEMLEDYEIWSLIDNMDEFIGGFKGTDLKGVLNE